MVRKRSKTSNRRKVFLRNVHLLIVLVEDTTDEDDKPSSLPTAKDYFRAGHTLDYDPITNKLLVFGGYNGPNELYVLNNASSLANETASETSWEKGES